MIAGGWDGYSRIRSVEILNSNESLSLENKTFAELPYGINARPTLFLQGENLILCGGLHEKKQCLMHREESWIEHSTLKKNRPWASAVTTGDGTYIFGGDASGGSSEKTFEFLPKNLKVWQEGRTEIPDGIQWGCAVEVPGKRQTLLIGGYQTETRILKFDMETQAFEVMDLSLLKKRRYPACARHSVEIVIQPLIEIKF